MRISDWSSDVCSSDLIHYCLAHVAAQVEGKARIAGAEQGAQFQRFGAMLRHLQDRHTLVPARIRGGAFLHLFPDTSDISARIYVAEQRPQTIAGLQGPVLVRLFQSEARRVGTAGFSTGRSRGEPY